VVAPLNLVGLQQHFLLPLWQAAPPQHLGQVTGELYSLVVEFGVEILQLPLDLGVERNHPPGLQVEVIVPLKAAILEGHHQIGQVYLELSRVNLRLITNAPANW
jgi:hypothetical protein